VVVPLFEMKLSKKPIAIIKMGDRGVTFVKINKYNSKYFTTKEGQTYELDDEYEYRYKKTGVYFYNFSNSKPLSLASISEIDEVMKDVGESELFNKDRFMSTVGNDPSIDVTTLNIPKDISNDMTPETKRFLQDHATDDETSKTDMMINVHTQRKPIPKYSPQLLGMGINRTGFAFVQIGYQRIDIVPMYVNDAKAYTQYGVFEIDKDNVYFLKKQMLCFFIVSNERDEIRPPMKKAPYKVMKTMVKKKRFDKIDSFIKPIPANGKNMDEHLKKKQPIPKSISISSEKKLVQYQADSPSVCFTTMKELHLTKEAVAKQLSDPLKKAIPVMLIFGAVMGIAVVMSNAPPVIDAVADRVVGRPDIFVMTPQEYEQWEIDNGLKEEGDRQYVAGLDKETYDKYIEAGGIPYIEGEETFLGVKQGVETEQESKVQTFLGVDVDPAIMQESDIPVIDTIAPVLTAPDILIYESDNTNGMKPKLIVSVVDNIDEGLVAECVPSKNKIFAIGKHDIQCHATDSSENVGWVEFSIEITVREGVEAVSIIPKIQPMPGQTLP
jgi:hypothetical protein